ncbi:MAG TPA: hypothetical protein PK364_13795 [Synergistaceae bacterium]|nr:hypothetical protein [Synergistaceae bacterium]HPJ25262.1 hypothetical protein [Synergistaceae bacterium]HPQ38324.1 hypothetical protein [Synergistaceae bacterium]
MDSYTHIYQSIPEFWGHWGFEPWQWKDLEGVWRRVDFKKSSLLGQVALYYSYDFIVWKHQGLLSKDFLLQHRKWEPDLMTQRFLLLGHERDPRPWIRSFFWGIRGFVEVFQYSPGEKGHRKFRDLTDLVCAVDGYVAKREDLSLQARGADSR